MQEFTNVWEEFKAIIHYIFHGDQFLLRRLLVSTMAAVRENYWITKLQELMKRVIRNCFGCKRFQVKPFATPPQGQLPIDRTTGSRPFQVIGTDFAGPIIYHAKNKRKKKSYILLFTCSLTRAIQLELLPDQTKEEFIRALKRFIARHGVQRQYIPIIQKTNQKLSEHQSYQVEIQFE